jgi:tetratricopeptide (TPR) repeat protein
VSVFVPRAEAEPLLREALRLAEEDGIGARDLGLLYHHLGSTCASLGKLEDAHEFLGRALPLVRTTTPDTAWATMSDLASLKYRLGYTDEALALYRKLCKRSTVWLPRMAEIELERGHRDEAVRLCEEALTRDASSWEPITGAERLVLVARVLERCGEVERALGLVERAVEQVRRVVSRELMSPSARAPSAVLEPMEAYLERLRRGSPS